MHMKKNKVIHFEFPFDEKERAESFYTGVFGWEPKDWEEFGYTSWNTTEVDENMMPKEPGAINGGMSKRDPEMPHPMFYIDVEDIETTLETVTKNGGEVARGKTQLGDMGYLAWFKDTEGNILGLTQWNKPTEEDK